ncbi:hypothetical protein EVAR_103144_1 [Eumeta japonica]|uniref:Uncharacterized protein n=1 Tax=Eumeta variegata TaxID=151549 RepID=A0A4C1YD17_EUMVA|nr:hypothetical protein EVAR_103144_1 [Eumeta japonica]
MNIPGKFIVGIDFPAFNSVHELPEKYKYYRNVLCQYPMGSQIVSHALYSLDLTPVKYNARNSAAVKLVTKTSQWRKIGTRGRRRNGWGKAD